MKKSLLIGIALLTLTACIKPEPNLNYYPQVILEKTLQEARDLIEKSCDDNRILFDVDKSQYQVTCTSNSFSSGGYGSGKLVVKFTLSGTDGNVKVKVRQTLISSNAYGHQFVQTLNTKAHFDSIQSILNEL